MSYARNALRIQLCEWLDRVAQTPPPPGIAALHFVLFEGMDGYGVYLMGAKAYDPWDDGWAGNEDWAPGGEERYFHQALLPAEIQGQGVGRGYSPARARELFAMEMAPIVESGQYDGLFKGRAVTCGFDGGDIQRLN